MLSYGNNCYEDCDTGWNSGWATTATTCDVVQKIKYQWTSNSCTSATSGQYFPRTIEYSTVSSATLGSIWTTKVRGTASTYYNEWECAPTFVTADTPNWKFNYKTKEETIKERLSKIIQSRHSPGIVVKDSKRTPLRVPMDVREQRARETLRRVIGDQKFVNFIKHGFISVRANSGLVYQIFPGHGITKVFDQGNLVERLCVVLKGDFPPTDSLIMRYLLIVNNENQFRSLAIQHSINQSNASHLIGTDDRSLTEIFKELKQAS